MAALVFLYINRNLLIAYKQTIMSFIGELLKNHKGFLSFI